MKLIISNVEAQLFEKTWFFEYHRVSTNPRINFKKTSIFKNPTFQMNLKITNSEKRRQIKPWKSSKCAKQTQSD